MVNKLGYTAIELLQLRVEPAARNAELGPRFEDAQVSREDIGILALRFGHQGVQHRIVEIVFRVALFAESLSG